MTFLGGMGADTAAVVACDTRSRLVGSGAVYDGEGKAFLTDRGWAVAGSWGRDGRPALLAAHRASIVSDGSVYGFMGRFFEDFDELSAELSTSSECGGRVLVASAEADGPKLHRFSTDKREPTLVEGCCLNAPADTSSERFHLHTEHILAAGSLPELIRRFATALVRIREESDRAGPWLHIGAVLAPPDAPVHEASWFGRAETLAAAADDQLRARAQRVSGPSRARTHDLDRGVTQTDGGVNHPLAKGLYFGTCRDNQQDGVVFEDELDVTFSSPPKVTLLPGGLSKDDANLTGNQYGPKFQALNLTKSGFDPSLALREPTAGSPTPETASWSAGATQDFEASKSTSGDVVDDEFTYRYHVFIGGNEIGGDCLGATQTVGHYVHKGVSWSQHSSAHYSSSCSDFDSDVSQSIAESGMEEGDESFGITKESGGGTLNPPNTGDDVAWEEGGTITTVTATPTGAAPVPFVAQSVAT